MELKLALIILFHVTVLITSIVCGCPDGFTRHNTSCYHFSHDEESWFDALIACERVLGSHLAEIHDTEVDSFLGREVSQHGYNYWIGGSDLAEEGVWQWMTTNQNMSYKGYWLPGEPNNSKDDEHCLELSSTHSPEHTWWNDAQCSVNKHYICERPENQGAIVG